MEKINNKKLILLLPLLCFLILTVVTIYLSCNYSVEGINEYEKKLSEDYIHFSLDELGNYDNVAFSCKKQAEFYFHHTEVCLSPNTAAMSLKIS